MPMQEGQVIPRPRVPRPKTLGFSDLLTVGEIESAPSKLQHHVSPVCRSGPEQAELTLRSLPLVHRTPLFVKTKTTLSCSALHDPPGLSSSDPDKNTNKKWATVFSKLTDRPKATNIKALASRAVSANTTTYAPAGDEAIVLTTELLPKPCTLSSSRLIGPWRRGAQTPHDLSSSSASRQLSAGLSVALLQARLRRLRAPYKDPTQEERTGVADPGGRGAVSADFVKRYLRAVETGRPTHHLLQPLEDLKVAVSTRWARRQRVIMVQEENDIKLPVMGDHQRGRDELERRVRAFILSKPT